MRRPIPPQDFAKEAAEIRSRFQPFHGEHAMRALEERWARHCLGVGSQRDIEAVVRGSARGGVKPEVAREAIVHLAEAQRWQHALGTYATSGAEGAVCMGGVYSYQMARAWLLAALAKREADPRLADEVAGLLDQVESDSNGMGKRHAQAIREIRQWLRAG
jgi:hypothetical protein